MISIKDIGMATKALSSLLKLLAVLGKLLQRGDLSIDLVKTESSITTEREESLRIKINSTSILIDPEGNISLLSPSSVAIKSRLMFLVSDEDPSHMDSFIAQSIAADKKGTFESHADLQEISQL